MPDLTNRISTVFRTETGQAEAAVRHLRGVERDEAKKTLESINAHNAGLENTIGVMLRVGAGVAGVGIAWKALSSAAKGAIEDMRLEAAAAGADVDRLREATHGLIETDKLLAFAGKAQAGVWKLNQAEMETVLKGATALRKTMGVELEPTIEKLTEAVSKGATKSLREFGIEAKDKQGALVELKKIVAELGGDTSLAGDDFEAAGVKLTDAMDDISGALGRLVIALAPAVEMLADFASSVADAATGTLSIVANDPKVKQQIEMAKELNKLAAEAQSSLEIPEATLFAEWEKQKAMSTKLFAMIMAGNNPFASASPRGGRGGRAVDDGRGGGIVGIESGSVLNYGAGGGAYGLGADQNATIAGIGGDLGGSGAIDSEQAEKIASAAERIAAAKNSVSGDEPSFFEQVFGKPEDISAYSVAIDMAKTAFEGTADAIAAGFEAWVTGSGSAIDAFKKVTAGFIHAMGMELAQVGAKHAILAAIDLVTGNPVGAGQHAIGSGLAFAGAAALFTVAAKMGHGQGGSSKPSVSGGGAGAALGGGGGGRPGRGDEARGERTTIVALGRDFNMLTDIEQRSMLNQAIRIGHADNGGTSHVRFR